MQTRLHLQIAMAVLMLWMPAQAFAGKTNIGDYSNLVCFVRFADEPASVFGKEFNTYQQLFNDATPGANSMYNYFKHSSYGQLDWRTSFYPAPNGAQIVSYRAKFERDFYRHYSAGINDVGYKDDNEANARLLALIKEVCADMEKNLPTNQVIDQDGDGFIDNICFVFSKSTEFSGKELLWPKRMDVITAPGKEVYIKGKRLVGYVMVFDEDNGYIMSQTGVQGIPLNTGLICHESAHALGTYDLYHANDNLNPVGVWDLMSDQQPKPQQMTAFTKMKYGKWIADIPEISDPGTYTLNPVGGSTKENIAYIIKPVGAKEYFVVEYRKKEGFDSSIPQSGLIVYRINPNTTGGNVNYNGTTILDETYIFRPGGTTTSDGDISKAAFSAESGRTAFGGNADQKPFYSDGSEAKFAITNVGNCGETITFTLAETAKQILLSTSELQLNGAANSAGNVMVASDVDWTLSALPTWLTASTTNGKAGETALTITAGQENNSAKERAATLTLTATDGSGISATLHIIQESNIIAAPKGLKAEKTTDGVRLTWTPVATGEQLLYEDFENTANPNQWVIENLGDRGWHWQLKDNTYIAYEGDYSAAMWSAFDGAPQDERLTSKTLANATSITFMSRGIMHLRTPKIPQVYAVEVSSDNGTTWTELTNLSKVDLPNNKYSEITLDLTGHQSETMKVRFHAYTENPNGLSYRWQVDNISIMGESADITLDGYNVYRNGEKIATVKTPQYTDTTPSDGDNVYAITAIGSFGESSPSAPASLTVSGIDGNSYQSTLKIVGVYNLNGTRLSTNHIPACHGVYIMKYMDSQGNTRTRKVIR